MTIDYRVRNIVIAAALAAAAVLLTVTYVSKARQDDAARKESVTVYVPSRTFPVGTAGTKIANNLEPTSVARASMAPEAVTDPAEIEELYTTEPVYAGEQLSLRRFAPPQEQGIRAQLTGKQRAIQLSGDSTQMLAGTLLPGDRVDIVANLRDPRNTQEVKAVVALRNLRVLQTDKGEGVKVSKPDNDEAAVILAMTDEQAQRLMWVKENGDWALQLRPVDKPRDSKARAATFLTVVNGGRST
jgi:Flp pilus assembly protein CpaB